MTTMSNKYVPTWERKYDPWDREPEYWETEEIEESENAKVKDEFSLDEIDLDTLELADEEFDLDLE